MINLQRHVLNGVSLRFYEEVGVGVVFKVAAGP